MRLKLIASIQALTAISALSLQRAPTVILDRGIFTGIQAGEVVQFLGIPFGKSTEGELRLQLPEAVDAYHGYHNVTAFGPSCPQQALHLPPLDLLPQASIDILNAAFSAQISPSSTSEDCLTVDVVKPVVIERGARLPVVVYIYGGGFEVGGSVARNGSKTVSRSLELELPVIFVAINYRVNGFGFLAGKEVRDAGIANLGLHDQRLALKWIQKYISAFGGDPSKVTLWGQSAGAISIAYQMLINNGDTEGLFRAGFMQSGSPMPVGGLENGQKYYDDVVERTGCVEAEDTLACLRTVEYDAFQAAIDASPTLFDYQSLNLAWMPRTDHVLFTDHPQHLVQQGKVAEIPIVTGDCDDEGTMFSLAQTNLSTDAQFKEWLQTFLLPTASEDDINRLMDVYPSDPAEGSPFNTGSDNVITPQFKRFASLLGDAVFQGPRRFFSHELSGRQDIYAYLYKGGKAIPALGSTHGLDIDIMDDYVIHFAATLDPSIGDGIVWPKWTSDTPDMLVIGADGLAIVQDTYREEAMDALEKVLFRNPM